MTRPKRPMTEVLRLPPVPGRPPPPPPLPLGKALRARALTCAPVALFAGFIQVASWLVRGGWDPASGWAGGVMVAMALILPPDAFSVWGGEVSHDRWRTFTAWRRRGELSGILAEPAVRRDARRRAVFLFGLSAPVLALILLPVLGDDGTDQDYFKKYVVLMHVLPIYSLILMGVFSFKPMAPGRVLAISGGVMIGCFLLALVLARQAALAAIPAGSLIAASVALVYYAGLRSGLTPGVPHSLESLDRLPEPGQKHRPGQRHRPLYR